MTDLCTGNVSQCLESGLRIINEVDTRTQFINSQNIRWLEPLTLLLLFGLLLALVWLMLS